MVSSLPERYRARWDHRDDFASWLGARFSLRWWTITRVANDGTAQKHPACGGAYRPPGCVAALSETATASLGAARLPG